MAPKAWGRSRSAAHQTWISCIEEHELTAVIRKIGCQKALDLAVNRKTCSVMLAKYQII